MPRDDERFQQTPSLLGWLDRVRGREETETVGGWMEEGRQRFKDSLLEILKNVDEFDRRLSR